MKFVSVRELRGKSRQVWEKLGKERELVVTSNGKPIAILSEAHEDYLEAHLKTLRQARFGWALDAIQQDAKKKGLDKMTMKEIDAIIQEVRRERKK